jgi:predicted transcriptional regulator
MRYMGRRSAYAIMSELLYVAVSGVSRTFLINSCNIHYKVCEKYITTLLEKGLLEKRGNHFHTTKKGVQFLETYQELENLLDKNVVSKLIQHTRIRKKKRLGLASRFA